MKKKYGLGIITDLSDINVEEQRNNFSEPKTKVSEKKGIIITNEPKNLLKPENIFDALHLEKRKCLTITIEESQKEPILIKKFLKKNASMHITIIAKENTNSIVFLELKGKARFASIFIEIIAEENSGVNYYEINEIEDAFIYSRRLSITEKNSKINFLVSDSKSKQVLSQTKALLKGENSKANLYEFYYGSKSRMDLYQEAEHAAKNTTSDIKSKGILIDAEAYNRGLIKINANAENSNGFEKSDTLLLGEARAVSIPDLLIHNDKVKCSHGSTISRLDENKLFYMRSRGISEKQARLELIEGFYEQTLKEIANTELMPRILGSILEKVREDVQ